MFSTPEKFCFKCFSSRSSRAASFFENCAMRPSSTMPFSSFNRLMDFCSVTQLVMRAAQPAVVHVEHPAAVGFFSDGFLRLALRPEKKNSFALSRLFSHVTRGVAEHLQGLLQVNNVDSIAFPENVFLHLRVPAARLVAKMNSSLQKLFHRNFDSQSSSSREGMLISPRPACDRWGSILFCRSFPAVN